MKLLPAAKLALLAVLFATSACGESPALTKIEARSLPPQTVLRRVLDQFSDIVILPAPETTSVPPKHPLTELYYATRPRGSTVPELCQADQVTFEFSPASAAEDSASAAMKVSGIEATKTFHFLAPPVASDVQMSPADRRALDGRCRNTDPETGFFQAEDDDLARTGILLLGQIQRDLASGTVPSSYHCETRAAEECVAIVEAATPDKVLSISSCTVFDAESAVSCTEIRASDVDLTVLSRGHDESLKPIRVKIQEMVMVADPREE